MSTNTQIIERATRHQVMIQRLGSGHVKQLIPIIRQLSQNIRAIVAAGTTELQANRLNVLLSEISEVYRQAGAQLSDELFDVLAEFAEYEAGFTQRMITPLISAETTLPATDQIRSALTQRQATLVSGRTTQRLTIRQLVQAFTDGKIREVDQIIRAGFIGGETTRDIAKNIQQVTGVKSQRQAEALIRTATNHAGSVAREAFYGANSDVIGEEEWVATLDLRTTLVCASRDGNKYPVGQGPITPAHYNCRSVRVPVVNPEFSLFGTDKGQRASMDGPISAQKTYSGWLRDQPAEFQDDVLGPARAKLFRSGRVTLDKFVDDMGRSLTLDEIRAREGLTLG